MKSVILYPENYLNLKHFSELKITSLENFVNSKLLQKELHRRKNLKVALETIIKVAFAYSKMGYKKIGISSSTFQNLLLCSKQTVFNFLNDIKQHFSDIIKVERTVDTTGRYRNFFEVNIEAVNQLSELLTEEEHRQLSSILKQLNISKSTEEILQLIKQDKKASNKELKQIIKKLLKKKEQFRYYLKQLLTNSTQKELTYETVEKMLEGRANNPDFIKAVEKLMKKGRNLQEAFEIAKVKYPPLV